MNPCPHELHEPRIPDAAEAAEAAAGDGEGEGDGVGVDCPGMLIPPLRAPVAGLGCCLVAE